MYQQRQFWELQSLDHGLQYDVPSFSAADQLQPDPYHQGHQFGYHPCHPPPNQPPDPLDWTQPEYSEFDHLPPLPSTQNLEPNLSMATLGSQIERLTAVVKQLVSQLDAKERCLGDPHSATGPPPAPVVLHVPPPEPAPPYELPLFESRETLPLGQQHYTDQEMSIPSLTPQPDDPYPHFLPTDELYPPVYNGEGYPSNSTIAGSMLPQPISHPLQLLDCMPLPQFAGSETLGQPRTFHAGYQQGHQLYFHQIAVTSAVDQPFYTASDAVGSPLHEPDRRMGLFAEMESHLAITDRRVDNLRPPDLPEPEPPNAPLVWQQPTSGPLSGFNLPPQRSPSCWSSTSPTIHCRSAVPLPVAAAALCSPDIVGDEDELLEDDRPPPTMMTLSCSPNIRYDSMELIVDDDSDESVKSCSSNAIDRLPNRDQVGIEEGLLDHEEMNGFPIASSRGMTIQELCFRARSEALECIPVGLDFCATFCSYGVKAMVVYCPRRPRMRVILDIHDVDEGAINALAVHRHIWIDIGYIECRKVGETSLGIITSLSPSRVSAKQRSCAFDPGGDNDRESLSLRIKKKWTDAFLHSLMLMRNLKTRCLRSWKWKKMTLSCVSCEGDASMFFIASWFPP